MSPGLKEWVDWVELVWVWEGHPLGMKYHGKTVGNSIKSTDSHCDIGV